MRLLDLEATGEIWGGDKYRVDQPAVDGILSGWIKTLHGGPRHHQHRRIYPLHLSAAL